jgi:exopolysaccharide production protein ExoZ
MFFYAIFAVAIAFRRPLLISTAVIIALVCAGLVVRPTSPAGGVYTNLYLLQFLAGVWIGHLHQRHGFERWGALLPVGFVALLFAPGSKITLGLAASAVLIGALSMETRLPRIPLLKAIGDSSYSLYLFHVLALSMVSRAISPIKTLHGWPQFLVWIATSLTVSCALAVLIFRFFEKPLTSKLTRAQQPSRALA